jgi:hypothetical protein
MNIIFHWCQGDLTINYHMECQKVPGGQTMNYLSPGCHEVPWWPNLKLSITWMSHGPLVAKPWTIYHMECQKVPGGLTMNYLSPGCQKVPGGQTMNYLSPGCHKVPWWPNHELSITWMSEGPWWPNHELSITLNVTRSLVAKPWAIYISPGCHKVPLVD